MEKITLKYVMKKKEISRNNIDKFFIYEDERRKIRTGKVASMVAGFEKSNGLKHFDSPLVISKTDNQLKVIDGNHRIEAIRRMIREKNKDFIIECWLAVYKGLDRNKERIIYSKWNSGTPETASDYLKWHFNTIPLGNKILNELPTSVYGSEKKFIMKNLVGGHLMAQKQKRFIGGYGAGGSKTVADFRDLTHTDINCIKEWYREMKEIFGEYYKKNPFYGTTPMAVFYRIWYDNKDLPFDKFKFGFDEVIVKKLAYWIVYMRSGGSGASKLFYDKVMEELKSHRKRTQWKSYRDIIGS